jgi:hypothetical protein
MQDIELKLVTNQTAAVKGIREVAVESDKLYKNNEKQQKRQIGLITDVENELKRLQEAQKNAMTTAQIEKFNKKIAEAKKDLEAYNKAGIEGNKEVEKSSNGLIQKIGKMALAYASVTVVIKALKETALAFFTKSQEGSELLERKISGLKASVAVLTGEFIKLGKSVAGEDDKATPWGTRIVKGMKAAIFTTSNWVNLFPGIKKSFVDLETRMNDAGKAAETYTRMLQDMEDAERAMIVPRAKANEEIIKARLIYYDTTKSAEMRVAALERAIELEQKTAEEEVRHQQWVILNLRDINNEKEKAGQLRNEDLDALEKAIAREIELRSESDRRQVTATTNLALLRKEFLNKSLEQQEKYNALALKLIDEYDKSMIDSLTGVDKLRAQRAFGLKQVEEFRNQLKALGTLTEEQERMFVALGENVQKAFAEGLLKEGIAPVESKNLLSNFIKSVTSKGLQKDAIPQFKEFSIWKMIGIDLETDDGKKQIDALKEAAAAITGVMDEIYERRVQDAERTRELAESRLQQAQSELETEIELFKAGYANNVGAKKKEIADLKVQREKAIKDEEKAVKAQRTFDNIAQVSSLITASAQTFKAFPGPLLPVAIAVVAAMFTAFAAAKASAAKATKLGHGGQGEVTGRLHSQGGERFLDHVEVEQGERWGVLSRSASRKYGKAFGQMVDTFNREKLPIPRGGLTVNNISVDNDGPNRRLDEVNSNLRQIRSMEEISQIGNRTIYKKGSTTRIIKR